ncbi:MAG: PilZ domain-containing protein [Deltaproteobacteria bacterium]|nr:PilZ domain-containing protein [Deltaproteobacteria bacterium]
MQLHRNRGFARNYKEIPIMFTDFNTDERIKAIMSDCSVAGMCFVTKKNLEPEADVFIETDTSSSGGRFPMAGKGGVRAEVMWCKSLDEGLRYCVGVKFLKKGR